MPNEKKKVYINKKFLFFCLLIVVAIMTVVLYSRYLGTKGLIVKEYKVTSSLIPDNFHGLKIVHLSDIHYGTTIKAKELENIVKEVNLLKPDVVVMTGDLLDKNEEVNQTELIDILSKIEATNNKYAISGNHEFGHPEWENIISKSGFINLDNSYDLIYQDGLEPILIAGVSSNLYGLSLDIKYQKISGFLESLKTSAESNIPKYKILLMHEPDYIDSIDKSEFNLILAGHSHNGQVRLPFIGALILPRGARKYYDEHYKFNDTQLYIASGLGTSTLPLRLFNKPAINFYRLTTK